jgi:DNA-binding NarL/FixJ family response regulator
MTLSTSPYKVLIVDDHAVVRQGLCTLLGAQDGIEVCSEASNGIEALEQAKKTKPDLVLLDLTMPDMNGLEAASAIRVACPQARIVVLSMHFSEEIAREVLSVGAQGYVLKSDANSELMTAIQRVRKGEHYFTNRLTDTLAKTFVRAKDAELELSPLPGTPLTSREVEVVQLLSKGKSNKEVSAVLGVSTRTIESHRTHIMHKMHFESFSELVRFAIRHNLIES